MRDIDQIQFFEAGKASMVVGGGFGSEGKGAAAAWLAHNYAPVDYATTNAGAQAGHTTRYRDEHLNFVCFHLPTVGVVQHRKNAQFGTAPRSYINGGSIIDPDVLIREVSDCGVDASSIRIHPRAAVITDDNRATERDFTSSTTRLGSTQKGVGAAISDKVMRRALLAERHHKLKGAIQQIDLNEVLNGMGRVSVEVPQGTGLSLNHGYNYPACTSRDCWVGSGLNDAGIHPKYLGEVCMVMRTFPIRVGNIFNEQGEKLSDSGPFYEDSKELDWSRDFPHLEPERTTVTKRVRRIATWSHDQYLEALSLNRPTVVFLSFCNYLRGPEAFWELFGRMRHAEELVGVDPAHIFNVGPCVEDTLTSPDEVAQWLKANF